MNTISHTWEPHEKQNRWKGVLTTVVWHAAVIAIFLLFGLSTTPPPLEQEGILINFGLTETGLGDQPSYVTNPGQQAIAETAPAAQPEQQQEPEQKILTQDVEDAPAIEKQPEKEKPKPKPEVQKPVEQPKKPVEQPKKPVPEGPKVDKTSLYPGTPGNPGQQSDENNPTNQGIAGGFGDQGDPNGDPSSDNYYGKTTGLGNVGVGHSLSGRELLTIPPINEKYAESGKVAVSVKVDRTGKVLFAKYTQKGSTTTDQQLIRLAEENARQGKFSQNSKAAEEQFGVITYVFKLE